MLGSDETPLASYLRSSGASVRAAGSWIRLARHLRRSQPNAIVTFGLRASLVVRFTRPLMRLSSRLVDARNGLEYARGRLLWGVDRSTQNLVSAYMTNSHAAAATLIAHGISGSRVFTNPSALRDEWFQVADVPRDVDRVLMVGNSRPEKAHTDGVRAIAAVPGRVHLVVYTDNGDTVRAAWDRWIVDDLKRLSIVEGTLVRPIDYATATVLLHPSRSESMPRSIMEAQAQGVRIVATSVGDTPRMLTQYDCCVRPGDLQSMSEAVSAALADGRTSREFRRHQPRALDEYCRDLLEVCGVQL